MLKGGRAPHASDCDFCRIAQGADTQVDIVCKASDWIAFFPPEPATPGHTIIIPRVHAPDIWALDSEVAAKLMQAVLKVGIAIRKALTPEGMNLISSSGQAAEQTVFHVHIHVVPRWERDQIGPIWPPKVRLEEELREHVRDDIRQACATEA